jgi:hypothetical protein
MQKAHWLRFGLRTFLLSITVLTVWIAAATYAARQQANAVACINAMLGSVRYDYQFNANGEPIPDATPVGPTWLTNLLGIDFLNSVVYVEIDGRPERDYSHAMECVGHLTRLRGARLVGLRSPTTNCQAFRLLGKWNPWT